MIVQMDLAEALREIEASVATAEHIVVPASVEPPSHNPYRPEYAWQFAFERRLLRTHREQLERYRDQLIGNGGLLSESLSNAYVHGNQRDISLPIVVTLFAGKGGYLLRVANSGKGFDVDGTLARFRSNVRYFHVAGSGLRHLASSAQFEAFFSTDGRAVHLLCRGAATQ